MTRAEARAAIETPAAAQGAVFEAGLVERLLDDVAGAPGNLPLLEFALTLLWERLDFGWLTHDAYQAIGRVQGALARYAQEEFEALTTEDQALARRIFTQLVQPGEGTEDTRRVAAREDLGDDAWDLVQHLADRRLVVTGRDPGTGAETAEVVHEALIQHWGQLQAWMAEDRAFRTWQERLRVGLRTWQATDQDEGALLRGAPLAEAEGWVADRGQDLSKMERAFIKAGLALRERRTAEREAQREREREAARRLAEAHAQALQEREGALRQAAIGLASEATLQMQGPHPDRAALLALEAVERYPYTWQAEHALANIAVNWRLSRQIALGVPIESRPEISPDCTQFLTADNGGRLRVWHIESGKQALNIKAYSGRTALRHWAYWSPSGDRILTHTFFDAAPRIWEAKTGRLLAEFPVDDRCAAEWAPEGARILTYGFQNPVAIWDARTGEALHTLPDSREVFASFSPDGRWVVTSRGQVWDASTGGLSHMLAGYEDDLSGDGGPLTWSPDGTCIGFAVGSVAHVWAVETGDEVLVLNTGYDGWTKLWWSPDGDRLLALNAHKAARPATLWAASTGKELRQFATPAPVNWGLNPWSRGGDLILLPDRSGHTTVWDAVSGELLLNIAAHEDRCEANWLPDNSAFITTGTDGLVRIWRLSNANFEIRCGPDCPPDTWNGFDMPAWSPDGTRIARPFDDGSIRVWDVASREEICRSQRTTNSSHTAITYLAWSPRGDRILTGAEDGGVEIWDPTSGQLLIATRGHDDFVMGVSWSPDGQRALSCARDLKAIVWNTRSGDALTVFTGQDFFWGAWSPDGTRIVLVDQFSFSGPVKIWDVATGEPLLTLLPEDFEYGTSGVAWSRDGTRIVTFSLDHVGRIWDPETGVLLQSFPARQYGLGPQWSPSDERVLTSEESHTRVWDAATLREVIDYPEGRSASWSPDGRWVAIGYANGDVKVFPAWESLEDLVAYAKDCCVLRDLTPEERAEFGLLERQTDD
jgi:WD40 repeat protein